MPYKCISNLFKIDIKKNRLTIIRPLRTQSDPIVSLKLSTLIRTSSFTVFHLTHKITLSCLSWTDYYVLLAI